MTGEDFYTQMHIELALEQCSVFVSLNTTFQQKEPNVTYSIESRCPNNCSGHGMCYNGGISLVISIFTFKWTHFFGVFCITNLCCCLCFIQIHIVVIYLIGLWNGPYFNIEKYLKLWYTKITQQSRHILWKITMFVFLLVFLFSIFLFSA